MQLADSCKRCLAVDIGGTLAKLCYIRPCDSSHPLEQAPHLQSLRIALSSTESIQFQHFRSNEVDQLIGYIDKYLPDYDEIALTGGGSFKYRHLFEAGRKILNVGEFESLLAGVESIRRLNSTNELISVRENKVIHHEIDSEDFYPFLMVNVGSGVSILKLSWSEGNVKCERVGGTCLGGGFFLGLSEMLVGSHSFSQLLEMASDGDNSKVDIVSGDFPELGKFMPELEDAPVLVSLGKMNSTSKDMEPHIVNALVKMVAYNLAQLALMHSELQQVDRLVFTGFFCRNNHFMIDCFGQAFRFFSKEHPYAKKTHAYGFKHDGYLGSLGALETLLQSNRKSNSK